MTTSRTKSSGVRSTDSSRYSFPNAVTRQPSSRRSSSERQIGTLMGMYPVTPESRPPDSGEPGKTYFLTPGDPLTVANIARLSLVTEISGVPGIRGGSGLQRKRISASSKSQESRGSITSRNTTQVSSRGEIFNDDFIRLNDWDHYGKVPKLLLEYQRAMSGIEGSRDWNDDQKIIHKLSFMRGHHPMIPSWWRGYFKMWGITQSELDGVFTPITNPKRVVIHAYGNELAGKLQRI